MNFKMAMEDFWRAMEREKKALRLQHAHECDSAHAAEQKQHSAADSSADSADSLEHAIGHLSLKKGEKIHINIKDAKGHSSRRERRQTAEHGGSGDHVVGGSGILLRKPPPPAGMSTSAEDGVKHDQSTDADEEDWGDFEG